MLTFLQLGFLLHILNIDHNPVPIPGGAVIGRMTLPQPVQRRLDQFPGFSTRRSEGEGCCGATAAAEAEPWIFHFCQDPAKSGPPPPVSFGSMHRPLSSPVTKRSFQRACKRALNQGKAGYHGKTWKLTDFPEHLIRKMAASRQPTDHAIRPPKQSSGRHQPRLRVMTWNPGGFSQSRFTELKHWLELHYMDIVVLPETRWSFDHNWTDDRWAFIHSAAPKHKSGGILVMVAKHLIAPDSIGFDPIIAGHLLHVRLHFDKRAIDVIAAYQHTYHSDAATMNLRLNFWNSLDELLHKLPNRNLMTIAGDFNCSLPCQSPWTGTDLFRWKGERVHATPHVDQSTFMDLLRRHGLTSLTCWTERTGPSFIHGDNASKIDHILIRLANCDGRSKDTQHLHDAAFLPCNQVHHIPVVCTLRTHHMAFQVHPTLTSCTYAQRDLCRKAAMQDSSSWHDLRSGVLHSLAQPVAGTSDQCPIHQAHDRILPIFHNLFQVKSHKRSKHHLASFHQAMHTKWDHKRAIRRLTRSGLRLTLNALFQAWFHWSRAQQIQHNQQRLARQAKLARFHELCSEVTVAARTHDAHAMFGVINRFSPRKPLIRARLRSADGGIADQYQAHAIMTEFVHRMWQGPAELPSRSLSVPGVPFSLQELTEAIAQVHPNKSVAQPFLPAAIWRCAPHETATFLMGLLTTWWNQCPPYIPPCWKDSWLFFLPKPGKSNTLPEHLRPISLMEPLGKIIMSLLATKMRNLLFPRLCQYPHFGFLPHRAATDAVERLTAWTGPSCSITWMICRFQMRFTP